MDEKVLVLDTSAFVAGFDPLSILERQYTVPMVREEIRENSIAWVRFKTAAESRKLAVRMPKEEFMNKVKNAATFVGDAFFLSKADLQVLALALELKTEGQFPLIVTDDYSIQNVANQIGIEFASLATFGIRFQLQWIRYCPACRKKYPADYKANRCEVCDTELKRKSVKKKVT